MKDYIIVSKFFCIIIILSFYIYGKVFKSKIHSELNIYEKDHIKIVRETAGEFTLFLNKNEEFPIEKPCKVLLIGSGARNTIKGGLGSGDVESRYYTTCEQGLESSGFIITSENWLDQYPLLKEQKIKEHLDYIQNIFDTYKGQGFAMVAFPEYEYDLQIDQEDKADIAIYVLSRNSGEGMDRRLIKGDVLLTDQEIKDIIHLNKRFQRFMLVLNVGGVVDLSPVKKVSNILLLSQLGVVTGDILADIILGKVNPSGKLATTWSKISDYKFINEFGDADETKYKEGVYVGYRYFNSEGIIPLYPFGYGQSYTSFSISKISLTNIKDEIIIKVKVKNIGKYCGKEVIQVYISPSQNNKDKPYQSLIAFKKTEYIEPGKEIEMTLKFKLRNVARYDEEKASYVLDKGKYIIRLGNSSENTKIFGYITLEENIITEKLKNIDGISGFEDYKPNIKLKDDLSDVQDIILTKKDFNVTTVDYTYTYKIYDKISKLENTDLAYMCVGGFRENEKRRGLNAITTKKVKKIKHHLRFADGPTGLRIARAYRIDSDRNHTIIRLNPDPVVINNYIYLSNLSEISLVKNDTEEDYSNYTNVFYQYTTAIPIATALAQSFNTILVEKYGNIIGKEMELYNVDVLLGPAMNIHRNILCGRNFEYYSEDPLVSGKMAAAFTKGVQSHKKKGTTLKHFAGNNQEKNRLNNNSKMSERALREIYLKGFQIAIEESQPIALMTSYNLINGIHPSENEQILINVVRSEWGFKGMIMTDWTKSGQMDFGTSKYPGQYVHKIIKAGNNIMMSGSKKDYKLILKKLDQNKLTRDDLLMCASKVYETIELLN